MLQEGINVLSATWCVPCTQYKEILQKAQLPYTVFDMEDDPEVFMRHKVRSVPTTLIVRDDQVVETIVGLTSPEELKSKL